MDVCIPLCAPCRSRILCSCPLGFPAAYGAAWVSPWHSPAGTPALAARSVPSPFLAAPGKCFPTPTPSFSANSCSFAGAVSPQASVGLLAEAFIVLACECPGGQAWPVRSEGHPTLASPDRAHVSGWLPCPASPCHKKEASAGSSHGRGHPLPVSGALMQALPDYRCGSSCCIVPASGGCSAMRPTPTS